MATSIGALLESTRAGADVEIAGQAGGTQQIAQLAQILSGATQTTRGTVRATGITREQEDIQKLVEAIKAATETADQTTDITGSVSASEKSQDSILGILSGFF